MIEGDDLGDVEQVGLGKEGIRTEALRDLLAPARRRPSEIPDVSAAEGRQIGRLFRLDGFERGPQRFEWMGREIGSRGELSRREGEPAWLRAAGSADVAVAAERSLEEEGVAARGLLLVEKTEDAERRQQITGKLDGGRAAPKAGSAVGGCASRE
jgi:hypothetical protein